VAPGVYLFNFNEAFTLWQIYSKLVRFIE
jgi:hypothetical protein